MAFRVSVEGQKREFPPIYYSASFETNSFVSPGYISLITFKFISFRFCFHLFVFFYLIPMS